MKNLFILLLCLANLLEGNAQVVSGVVVDDNKNVVPNALIQDTISQLSVLSDLKGRFKLNLSQVTVLEVSRQGYDTVYMSSNSKLDTIILIPKERLLTTISVNSDKLVEVMDIQNQNILDYLWVEDYLFILCSIKSVKYLMVMEGATIIREFELLNVDAKSLFEDCYGNIHILTKAKAIQIKIDEDLHYVQEATISDFNTILKPCVGIIDDFFFITSFSDHNQRFTLATKQVEETDYEPILTVFDRETRLSAARLFNEIIYEYQFVYSDTVSDLILNGVWSGDIKDLALNYQLMNKIGFYDKVLAKELSVRSFKQDDQIVTFDMVFDSVYIYNGINNEHSKLFYNLGSQNSATKDVLFDKGKNQFYLLSNRKGVYSLEVIDLLRDHSGEPIRLEQPFAENIKIHNGWVYFLVNENGFRKLFKQKY